MRLAFVNSTRRWGGVKTWCMDMGRCALAQGHGVFVYGRDQRFVDNARDAGMSSRLVSFGPDFNPVRIAFFCREFARNKISHVIVNVGKDLRTAGVAAKLSGLPLTVHIGAPADFTDTRLRRLVHTWLRPAYVCCSAFTRDRILENVPWLRDARVEAIHPGTAMPAALPCPSAPPYRLITTSQLTPPKRHVDLIRACALLRDQGMTFTLRIVGTGDQEAALKSLTEELCLNDRIEFRGYVPDVATELRQADIFVLPTEAEPLGIALEEAMAHGLFPVARHAGGVPEIWPQEFRSALISSDIGTDVLTDAKPYVLTDVGTNVGADSGSSELTAAPEAFANVLRPLLLLPPEELDRRRLAVQAHARMSFNSEKQFAELEGFLSS